MKIISDAAAAELRNSTTLSEEAKSEIIQIFETVAAARPSFSAVYEAKRNLTEMTAAGAELPPQAAEDKAALYRTRDAALSELPEQISRIEHWAILTEAASGHHALAEELRDVVGWLRFTARELQSYDLLR
jgi:hypothetical protein